VGSTPTSREGRGAVLKLTVKEMDAIEEAKKLKNEGVDCYSVLPIDREPTRTEKIIHLRACLVNVYEEFDRRVLRLSMWKRAKQTNSPDKKHLRIDSLDERTDHMRRRLVDYYNYLIREETQLI
jgi:hypothetical protein